MIKKLYLTLLLLPLIWFNSCHSTVNEIDYNPDVLSAKDYVRGEDAIFEIVNSFFKGVHDTLVLNQGYGYIDACGVVYVPAENIITFGYGPVNRMCQDGKYRRGSFYANFSGQVFDEGISADITTDSLFVDDLLVEAHLVIQNLGLNTESIGEYSMKVESSLITLPDTVKISKVSIITDFVMAWTVGSSTPGIHEDDVFMISGTAAGLSSDNYDFTISVQDPLEDYIDCFWISKGINLINVPVAEFPSGDIDYITDDGCFNELNFTFNGNLFYDMIK